MTETTTTTTNEMKKTIDHLIIMEIMRNFTRNTNNELKEIIDYDVIPLNEKGANYLSEISKLTVNYRLEESGEAIENISFIIKTKLQSDVFNQLEESCNIFQREIHFYKDISNGFKFILKSINDDLIIGPNCLYLNDDILVLENLLRLDYKLQDVKQGLNFQQLQLVVQHLAKFHALSMLLYQMNPDLYRYHLKSNITEQHSIFHDFYINALATSIDYCKDQKDLMIYVERLKSFQTKIIEEIIQVFTRKTNDRYHVLNHGDMWVNNLLFKDAENSNGKAKVLFIDFQEGFYGSPAIDLNNLIFTSCRVDVFQNHLNDLLSNYHETLNEFLKKINYSNYIPSLEDVRMEFLKKGSHGLATATCLLPVLISECSEVINPDVFLQNTDLALTNRRLIFDNPNYKKRLQLFLKYFSENNIL